MIQTQGWRRDDVRRSRAQEIGASAVEYGLLIAGIAATIALVIYALGGSQDGAYNKSCKTIFEGTSTGSCQ